MGHHLDGIWQKMLLLVIVGPSNRREAVAGSGGIRKVARLTQLVSAKTHQVICVKAECCRSLPRFTAPFGGTRPALGRRRAYPAYPVPPPPLHSGGRHLMQFTLSTDSLLSRLLHQNQLRCGRCSVPLAFLLHFFLKCGPRETPTERRARWPAAPVRGVEGPISP